MLAQGITVSAEFLYRNVLVPGSQAIVALGHGLVSGATLVYAYFLLPCAGGIAFVARGVSHGVCAVASGLPAAAGATYQVIAVGASNFYVCILQPFGHTLYTVGTAVVGGVQNVVTFIVHHVAAGAQ